ncbi:BTB/POZ and MATH domain-containing protein 4 [Striga hermonthica]|uniref:BTB/POZ and MATH domain-containing protein 4 n=1 Tax=Striga hermonthica TaxID=68872 RepID=A0A9N7N2T4_STRHE|nr:BTB/POZ and MATH domain-containing protein 4 [Striga hermonthica]
MEKAVASKCFSRTIQEGSTEWALRNYSRRRSSGFRKPIESNDFTIGRCRWTLHLYPGGHSLKAHRSGYSSLFLKYNSGGSVWFLYELYLLDQSGKGNHLGFSFFGGASSGGINIPAQGYTVGKYFFVRRAVLESPDYLKDDCVRIRCRIAVFTGRALDLPLIRDDGAQPWERNRRANVLFQVGNEQVYGHRWVLAASSSVLGWDLSHPERYSNGLFVIHDVEPRIFKAMLQFIYTGILEEDDQEFVTYAGSFVLDSFIGKVLAAAYQFRVEKLKKLCESRILSKLSVESVAYLLHLADHYHATELKAACLKFAAENRDAVLETKGCEYLRQSCPLLYIHLNPSASVGWELRVTSKILSAIEPFVGLMTWWMEVAV